MSLFARLRMPLPEEALPGRSVTPYSVPSEHAVLGSSLQGPWHTETEDTETEDTETEDTGTAAGATGTAWFALGCFWGAERIFWRLPGVVSTAAGYMGGFTPNPTYEEVCTGRTGHAETVQVVYDPARISYGELLRAFWESHDPTQGNRQGNDIGTEYRSAVFVATAKQRREAEASRAAYDSALRSAGRGAVTTEVTEGGPFYYAEGYHQQYLHKVPYGYCGIQGTGVSCPLPAARSESSAESS